MEHRNLLKGKALLHRLQGLQGFGSPFIDTGHAPDPTPVSVLSSGTKAHHFRRIA